MIPTKIINITIGGSFIEADSTRGGVIGCHRTTRLKISFSDDLSGKLFGVGLKYRLILNNYIAELIRITGQDYFEYPLPFAATADEILRLQLIVADEDQAVFKSDILCLTFDPTLDENGAEIQEKYSGLLENALSKFEKLCDKFPYIGENTHWYFYDIEKEEYIDSGVSCNGGNASTLEGKHYTDFAPYDHTHSGYAELSHKHSASDITSGVFSTARIPTITSAKLGNSVVTSEKLADKAVITAKLADNSVGVSKLADGAVTASKLARGVTNELIWEGVAQSITDLSIPEDCLFGWFGGYEKIQFIVSLTTLPIRTSFSTGDSEYIPQNGFDVGTSPTNQIFAPVCSTFTHTVNLEPLSDSRDNAIYSIDNDSSVVVIPTAYNDQYSYTMSVGSQAIVFVLHKSAGSITVDISVNYRQKTISNQTMLITSVAIAGIK